MSQMPPKPTQLQSTAVQQNNNINNTYRVDRPTPRNNEPTGTRLSQVHLETLRLYFVLSLWT